MMGERFRQFVYGLSSIVMLALGAFLLFLGVTVESSILAGIGVALGMIFGAVGLAAFLDFSHLGSRLSGWLR